MLNTSAKSSNNFNNGSLSVPTTSKHTHHSTCTIYRSQPPPKTCGKKLKATTKVTAITAKPIFSQLFIIIFTAHTLQDFPIEK